MAATANGTETSVHANGTSGGVAPPKIHLYTNHRCPYAHRAHIALSELGLPYEETIIDLDTPRPQWYLDINPRGLVPSIKYTVPGIENEEIIYESGIVAQFLCDSFPSPLLPSTREDPTAPLRRARVNFFIDTWNSKLSSSQMGVMKAPSAEKDDKVKEWVATIEKEIEPLLANTSDKAPFFGGSTELTFAEVIVAPFLVRSFAFAKQGKYVPSSFMKMVEGLPNFSRWSKAVSEHPSVTKIYNEKESTEGFAKKYGKMMEEVK
ncbi:hypothetical protein LTR37_012640 [Vermiconidia calcicola]|uniref:Uncharacterized protein n=1 Tax=Vermiconidia calcicola TaxID=1690605 RepID=A0ACC3N0C2_9PEZI|nr:hypothetical protein LTR37_012640 [Vermiconidia calcicola]